MPRLPIAAEDRFALIDLSGPENTLLPSFDVMREIVFASTWVGRRWTFLWDLRRLGEQVYNDTVDAFTGVWAEREDLGEQEAPTILIPPGRRATVEAAFGSMPLRVIEMERKDARWQDLPLEAFETRLDGSPAVTLGLGVEQSFYAYAEGNLDLAAAMAAASSDRPSSQVDDDLLRDTAFAAFAADDPLNAARIVERASVLDRAFSEVTTHSMLTQLAVEEHCGEIFVTPYHGSSLHNVATREDTVLLRPARVNTRYWAMFRRSLDRLQTLLNTPRASERELEELLTDNPLLLGSLGYGELYHQVVLPRPGATDLRPDVIAEPAGSEWAEIVELKLPREPILVGRRDRAQLAAGLMQAVAQLREYSAYFEDRAAAKAIEDLTGLRCYKPKLTVIIGRDPTRFSPEQRRRALTAYPDLRVVTYDELVSAAQRRLLM